MKANADKYHLLTSSNKESTICIDNNIIINTKCEKLLGVKIDQKLNFNPHINDISISKEALLFMSYLCLNSTTALWCGFAIDAL